MIRQLKWLLLLILLAAGIGHAFAAVPAQSVAPQSAAPSLASQPVSAAQARQAIDVLNDPAKRAQVLDTLEAIARAQSALPAPPATPAPAPAKAEAAAPAGQPGAASHPAAAKPEPAKPTVALKRNSLGAQLLLGASGLVGQLSAQALRTARTVQSLPLLWGWLVVMATNPLAHSLLQEAVWRVAVAYAAGLVLEAAVRWLVRRPISILERRAAPTDTTPAGAPPPPDLPEDGEAAAEAGETEQRPRRRLAAAALMRRVPLVLARFLFDLLPVLAFAIAGHIVAASSLAGSEQTRLVVIAMIDAYAICAGIMCFARMLFSPERPGLRLLRVSNVTAAWAMRWIRRLTAVVIFGYAIAEVGVALGMSAPAHDGLLKIISLIDHLFLAIMVLEKRRAVQLWLLAPAEATGSLARIRNAVAPVWHWIALFFLIATWITWAIEIRNGFALMLRFFGTIVLVAVLARLALIVLYGLLERAGQVRPELASRYPDLPTRLAFYQPAVHALARAVVYIAAFAVLLEFWGVPLFGWFATTMLGHRLAAGLGTIAFTLLLAILVWEAVNLAIQRHLARLTREQHVARSARLRTLLPLLRAGLMVLIVIIAGLTVLSEIGIDIGPLLAGAGIVGVAIGFGSQKLVQDLITGIFLLLENAMQVGDQVTVSGLTGSVENLSVRTIRLRATDGSVHIIPFSSVTSVTNINRGIGNAAVSVTVAYDEDTDRVSQLLKDIAAEMREDPAFAPSILTDLQLWGVDKVDGGSATIAGQIPCTDTGRWPVQREFNRRVKRRFQELGVEIYNPAQTLVVPILPESRTRPALPATQEAAAK